MSQDDMHRMAFREEAGELLGELEASLLALEDQPEDQDLINRVFRAMHTIKGSGAMFGFEDIAAFTHEVETVFDKVRNGLLPVSKTLLDLTLAARDHIKLLLEAADTADGPDPAIALQGQGILDGLRRFSPAAPVQAEAPAVMPETVRGMATYRIRFKPGPGFYATGNNPLHFLEDLAELGDMRRYLHAEEVPCLEDMDPEVCHVWWDIILGARKSYSQIQDVFAFVEDDCELAIDQIDNGEALSDAGVYKKLGEILVERGDLTPDDLAQALAAQKRLGTVLADSGLVAKSKIEAALVEQEAVREIRKAREPAAESASSIRVAAEKLDDLVDLVGELVIVQSQIKQEALAGNDPTLKALSEHLERLSDDLRDSTLGIRMLPIGSTFSRFRRLVRDLSAELGKEIDLVTSGEETELDKTVIERLGDPLVHLLRNSIDHGVERPDERRASGKPPRGTVFLSAEHSGGSVVIRITDDGRGLDARAIRAKAVERGVLPPEAELCDKDLFNLIFLPGFSTAKAITNVSGRGVGMDVVKRAIESLRGAVEIDSVPGQGTTITVRLPLTLAIIDGLQIQTGREFYVAPLSLVEECVDLPRDEAGEGDKIINLRGEIVPYIRLRDFFGIDGCPPDVEQVVVSSVEGSRVGLVVDRVIGEHQTVIKSLGRIYRDVEGLSGATIKGDGTMALILDVPGLLRAAVESGN
ncbi:chemotaxis protein CheA [Desulfovibrio sulfodismutans]|uniref:Chemotaxis protein CheA n=1 Tax=Desulfolutivibrio sulfodismutans TaxID=63561 RepID=A0A7K3NLV3_9BACT|nr:chemotaxis protein CheA [Desulfolutivibrio sulfodismutans]NDY57087.1 chemotaxis protein CheA [Desulfolutivibrio sulfodismutans]QLA11716.1 chemotaxis protein CheA [Desulfolutivibrio sulfodismutans DSM 3696]